jgi:hypothetical protein
MIAPEKDRLYINRERFPLELLWPINYGVIVRLKINYRPDGFLLLLRFEMLLRLYFGGMAADQGEQQ